MKHLHFFALFFFVACNPQSVERPSVAHSSNLSSSSELTNGIWKTTREECDLDLGASCQVFDLELSFTQTSVKFDYFYENTRNSVVQLNSKRNIQGLDGDSYQDLTVQSTVYYEVNGDQLRICYDDLNDCYELYR